MVTQVKPSDFPRDEKFRDPSTAAFRDEQSAYHVFSYRDVKRVLMNSDGAFSRDPSPWLPPGVRHMALEFMWTVEPFTLDGAEEGRHDALRAVVEPWFRVRAVRTMEPVIREVARELLAGIVDKAAGQFDLARELAYRMSIRVICKLVGIELEQEQFLREKLDEFSQAGSYDKIPRQWDLEAYFWELVAKRLARPRDELLDVLVAAWKDGRLTDREMLGYIMGFVAAGTDTTGTSLANAFSLLAEFGCLEQVRNNLDDRRALSRTVEEILRFGTPFPVKPLFVLKNVAFGRLEVPKGSVLNAWYVAANRDPAVNGGVQQSDPNVFDPNRSPNRHLGLGYGRHYCLGGDLARLETRILLQEALRCLPGLHMDETMPFKRYAGITDNVTEAHFQFDQQEAERIARDVSAYGRSWANSAVH